MKADFDTWRKKMVSAMEKEKLNAYAARVSHKTFCSICRYFFEKVRCCFTSCKGDDDSSMEYNPNEEVVLSSFNPTKGPLASQVILYGQNFGNNKEIVKVFFNEKEASVISATGNKILVLAPRLPGEECVIKVKVGEQEQTYKDIFDYVIQTNVTTLVGGVKSDANPRGTVSLSEAQFKKNINKAEPEYHWHS